MPIVSANVASIKIESQEDTGINIIDTAVAYDSANNVLGRAGASGSFHLGYLRYDFQRDLHQSAGRYHRAGSPLD